MHDNNIHMFKCIPSVIDISKALKEQSKISFMLYSRLYDNGYFFELPTVKEWGEHYWAKYMSQENTISHSRIKVGINYWKSKTGTLLTEIQEDARDNFDIDARMDIIYRDEFNKCFHQYSFYSDKKNADAAYSFYDIHRIQILKFISYFNHKASELMIEGNRTDNLLQISGYKNIEQKTANAKRDYAAELQANGESLDLTDREFEIMVLYAGGATAKQIASMLNKSPKTIETHLDNLRKKIGHADRFSMHKYIIDNGWGDIIRFFFSLHSPRGGLNFISSEYKI